MFYMKNNVYRPAFLCLLSLSVIFACQKQETDDTEQIGSDDITALPLIPIELNNLQNFRSPGVNWSIAENVQSDFNTEHSMEVIGNNGVLVNIPSDELEENIFTELEHGDIELKLEFLVPKGSNSGLYFQSRYEVQIFDSWRVENPQFSDTGGIYARWDATQPEGERDVEGSAPIVNASLAPGLWQEYHILFRAPRFDDNGNKIENARFEWVYLNGALVQENVEVTGPTIEAAYDNEVASAPLMIQGDHGPVAFRNIRYKTYNQVDSLRLGELEYTVYDYDGDRTPVDFEDLTVIAEGVTDYFNVSEISPKNEHFATRFNGDLYVPVAGDYLFQTQMSNGGNLYINGDLIAEHTGEYDEREPGNIIHLTEGTHQLELTHFQIMWGTNASLFYEGPNMERRRLGAEQQEAAGTPPSPVTVTPGSDFPERIGGFVNYGGEKRTHVLTVGHPEGIHYSYDLNRASLLIFWREPFADVSEMWHGRGHEQLLVPMNAAVEESAGIPIVRLDSDDTFDNHRMSVEPSVTEYQLDERGQPVFISGYNGITLRDHIRPSDTTSEFIRTLHYSSDNNRDNTAARIAQGSIELLSNGLYRINGRYYLDIIENGGDDPEIHERNGTQALFIPILRNSNQSEIQYQLIW